MPTRGPKEEEEQNRIFSARMAPDGPVFDAPAMLPLLEAAELAGLAPASSCRNGTCRTCICRLAGGSVRYLVEWPGLSLDEKREGYILPCVAVAQENLLVDQRLAKKVVFPE